MWEGGYTSKSCRQQQISMTIDIMIALQEKNIRIEYRNLLQFHTPLMAARIIYLYRNPHFWINDDTD